MSAGDCLQCCRWFCCVFLVLFNVLGGLIGLLLLLLGCVLLWGQVLLKSVTQESMKEIVEAMKEATKSDINLQDLYQEMTQMLTAAAAVFIVLGIVLLLISCLGCCGACCAVPACLIIYAVAVSLLFLAQVALIVVWFADQNLLKQFVRSSLKQQVEKFTGYRSTNIQSVTLNTIQMVLGCCGVDNGTDFHTMSPNWQRNYTITDSNNRTFTFNLTYPVTCCKFKSGTAMQLVDDYCPYNGTKDVSNMEVGCYDKVFQQVETYFKLNNFFFSLIGGGGLELLLILGAILIYCAKRREDEPEYREGVQYKMQPMA